MCFVLQGYGHIALGSQFVLLVALSLYFDESRRTKSWTALFVATTLIHAYFIPMVGAIWVAKLFRNKTPKTKRLPHVAIVGGATFAAMALGGYVALGPDLFLGSSSVTPTDFPYRFRWQPLSPINSATDFSSGWSKVFPNQAQLFGDVKGFSYLGSDVIALVCVVFCAIVWHHLPSNLTTVMQLSRWPAVGSPPTLHGNHHLSTNGGFRWPSVTQTS